MTIGLRNIRCEIIALAILAISCGDSPSRPAVPGAPVQPSPEAPTPTSLRIIGPARVAPGETVSYTALATYAVGSEKDVTASSSWVPQSIPSSSPIYFTAPGVALGRRPGEGPVSASLGGRMASMHVLILEAGTFRLTGVVSEIHGQTLFGISIDVIGGTGRGLHTTTDMNGRFTLYGVAGRVQLRASADGLAAVTREVEVLSDSESDAFVRVSMDAPSDISGPWTMTLSPAADCPAGFPEIAMGRTYEVRFTQTGTYLKVATSSPTLEVRNPNENDGTIFGSSLRFFFIGDTDYGSWSSADLIDHLSATERLEFDGMVVGTVTGSEIRARMDGDLVFWDKRVTPLGPSWYCRNANHLVTLRRQP